MLLNFVNSCRRKHIPDPSVWVRIFLGDQTYSSIPFFFILKEMRFQLNKMLPKMSSHWFAIVSQRVFPSNILKTLNPMEKYSCKPRTRVPSVEIALSCHSLHSIRWDVRQDGTITTFCTCQSWFSFYFLAKTSLSSAKTRVNEEKLLKALL